MNLYPTFTKPANMATLKDVHKTFIVQELACFQSYSEVAGSVKQMFGLEIERQQVYSYDPTRNKIAAKWTAIFDATRAKFLDDISKIPIANKAVRLFELQKIYENQKAAKSQNTKAMKDTLEQAAKESGDAFSNKQKLEHTGKDGAPIETKQSVDLSRLSTEELIQWKKLVEKTNG